MKDRTDSNQIRHDKKAQFVFGLQLINFSNFGIKAHTQTPTQTPKIFSNPLFWPFPIIQRS